MANLIVSNACNLNCPYCFAGASIQGQKNHPQQAYISIENFEQQLDFLDRSQINEIRLLGGEPTLHPNFPELIQRAKQHKKHIVVFTNGLFSEVVLQCIVDLSPEDCTVLLNMNASGRIGLSKKAQARRQHNLERLGPRALLGYTIYSLDFDLRPILEQSRTHQCHKVIRLGLAQPTLSGRNSFVQPKHYPQVGQRIAEMAPYAAELGRVLEFDCGFVCCMFSDDALEKLKKAGSKPAYHCSAILDMDGDGSVYHCFPLADRARTTWNNTSTAANLRTELTQQVQEYRTAGIYKECSSCSLWLGGECSGGCLANTIRRFWKPEFVLRIPQS